MTSGDSSTMNTAELRHETGGATGNHAAFRLLLSCPSGLSPSQVSVIFDQSYDRVPHPDYNLESSISEIWESRVQQNPSLFNGLKFRYGGHGIIVDDWRRCQHTSNPLGNGAIVETLDKAIVVLQRSNNVGEFPGHFVFPGGHPEPQEVGIATHQSTQELSRQKTNTKVSQEMFDSIIREVVEEVGVPPATLSDPIFIGISQRVLNVRPTAFFFIKCNLQSHEIQQLYCSAQDSYESTRLYTMSVSDLAAAALKMPGCHQGGFALYKLMIDVQENS